LSYLFFFQSLSAKANTRGYRAPNIAEISANGVHPGTGIFQVGNPDFNPEFNLQEDVGVNFTSQYAVINLSGFYNAISNYIFNEKILNASGTDSIRDDNMVYQYRQGRAALYGGEFSIDIHPVKNIHFYNTLSLVYETYFLPLGNR
jgi:iron complex outermembrane receptor protein